MRRARLPALVLAGLTLPAALLLWAVREAEGERREVERALRTEAALLAQTLGPALAAASAAARELDELLARKLLDDARLFARLEAAGALSPAAAAELLLASDALDGLWRLGPDGAVRWRAGAAGDHALLRDGLAPLLAGDAEELLLGSAGGADPLAAAVRTGDGGALAALADRRRAYAFGRQLGVENLLRRLVTNDAVLYLTYEERPGGPRAAAAWDGGPAPASGAAPRGLAARPAGLRGDGAGGRAGGADRGPARRPRRRAAAPRGDRRRPAHRALGRAACRPGGRGRRLRPGAARPRPRAGGGAPPSRRRRGQPAAERASGGGRRARRRPRPPGAQPPQRHRHRGAADRAPQRRRPRRRARRPHPPGGGADGRIARRVPRPRAPRGRAARRHRPGCAGARRARPPRAGGRRQGGAAARHDRGGGGAGGRRGAARRRRQPGAQRHRREPGRGRDRSRRLGAAATGARPRPGARRGPRDRPGPPRPRLRPVRHQPRRGHRLGLALVRRVAEEHGGRAALRNHPGGGVEASLEIPAEAAA